MNFRSCLLLALAACGAVLPQPASAQTDGNDPYKAIIKREFGTASNEMAAIDKEIQDARPEQLPKIEDRLIAVLDSPEATLPGKQFACQMLRTVGSAKCVPAVSKLLTDEKLSHSARNVLLGMRGAAVDEALRKALNATAGNLRIGIINTIGDRSDRQSLESLGALLKNDEATVRSALNAIGKIGGAEAAKVLDRAKMGGPLREAWAHAYLRCAGSVAAAGDATRATKMYQSLFEGDYPPAIRAAALPAVAQAQKERAVPMIVKLLSSEEAILRRAAASAVATVPGNAATKALVKALSGLAPESKAKLLGALAIRGDGQGATAAVNTLAKDENPVVREAAIKALGRLGSAESIPVLVTALKEGGAMGADANRALAELRGAGVTEALIKNSEAGDVAVREAMLKVLMDRGQAEALPVFRKALNDENVAIRRAALKTIGVMGTEEDMGRLAGMLASRQDELERQLVAGAMSDIGARITDTSVRCEPVLQALGKADASTKASLLKVLSSLGGDKALQAVRGSLSGEPEVRKAAVRALADWPDPAPMPDLLGLAKDNKDESDQIVALRGYIKMAGAAGGRTKVQAYREAMEVATRPEEKWLVLSGLADVSQVESLKAVEPCLEDPALNREAFAAYEKIAESLANRHPGAAKEALQKVVEKAADNGVRNKAKAALDKISQ